MLGPQIEDDRPEHPVLFISYASADVERAAALHSALVAEGFKVWFDKARLTPGYDWQKEVKAGCEAARIMLPLMTPRWAKSEWTRYETYAHDVIIPVLVEGKAEDVIPGPLRRWQAVKLEPLATEKTTWQALLGAIRTKLAKRPIEPAPPNRDLPYFANPYFTGRDDDIVRIHEELYATPVATLTQRRVLVVSGMGGLGKSTLANEYVRRYWRLHPQILWVDARAGVETGFGLLFGKLFPSRSDTETTPLEKAKLVLEELSSEAERLLVLDNVEDAKSVHPWLVRNPTSGCRTLITSRFTDWPAAAGIRNIELLQLKPEAARKFLLERTQRKAEGSERAACDDLARALGYLPLALEQAAAYIAAPGAGINFQNYLRLYHEFEQELLGRQVLGSTEYPDSVITTWRVTLARLSPESRAVLRLCASYADTPVPSMLVLDGAEDVLALAVAFGLRTQPSEKSRAELRMRDAMTGLAQYSMILDADDTTFRMHALVQTVERMNAKEEHLDELNRTHAVRRLAATFPKIARRYDTDNWPLCRLLTPHLRVLLDRVGPHYARIELADLLANADYFLHGSGDAAGAAVMVRRCLSIREQLLPKDHSDTLTSMNNLAGCLYELGEMVEAAFLDRRVLAARKRTLKPKQCHPDTLMSMDNLGMDLQAMGEPAAALPLHRRALAGRRRVLGDNADTFASVSNLAKCMQALGDAAKALPLHQCALDGFERRRGPDHGRTFRSVNDLAECWRALGKAAIALPLYQRALDGSENKLGRDHPDTLIYVHNLAACLDALGHFADAEVMHRRAFEGLIRKFGPEHRDVLMSQSSLALILCKTGHADLAESYARQCADASKKVFGEAHPLALDRSNRFAITLLMLRRAAEARFLLATSWAVSRPNRAPLTQAIAFLAAIAALLDGGDVADPLGRLKTLMLGPKLQQAPGISSPWDARYLLEALRDALPLETFDFLQAILAAINDTTLVPALERFSCWRDTPAVSLSTPWPHSYD